MFSIPREQWLNIPGEVLNAKVNVAISTHLAFTDHEKGV